MQDYKHAFFLSYFCFNQALTSAATAPRKFMSFLTTKDRTIWSRKTSAAKWVAVFINNLWSCGFFCNPLKKKKKLISLKSFFKENIVKKQNHMLCTVGSRMFWSKTVICARYTALTVTIIIVVPKPNPNNNHNSIPHANLKPLSLSPVSFTHCTWLRLYWFCLVG